MIYTDVQNRGPAGPLSSQPLSGKARILSRLIHDRNVGMLADEAMLDNYSMLGK
jgi:hypothetical protein